MLLIISNRGIVTGEELAEHFEVSLRTIYRDIDKACEAGIPIASKGGKGGGFYIMENYNLDKLFFNKDEIQTLMPLMNSLSFLFGKNQQFNDIILKFENSYQKEKYHHDKLTLNLSHFSMEKELKDYLFLINKALEDSRLMIFDYINRNMAYSQRIAEPIGIAYSHGQWYVTAFCRKRNDYRKFKLVRMRHLKRGDTFTKRDISKETLEKAFMDSYDKKSIKVILRFKDKIGEQLREYFIKDTIEKIEDGSFLVEDYFPYEEGLIKFILSFGKECEVVEPLYLREETREYLEKILKQYKEIHTGTNPRDMRT